MNFVKYLLRESKKLLRSRSQFKVKEEENLNDPLPKVDIAAHPYAFNKLHMALLDKNNQAICNVMHCRDYLNEAIRWYVCKPGTVSSFHCTESERGKFDFVNLRLVLLLDLPLSSKITIREGIENGVYVANMYGRVAGWKPIEIYEATAPKNPNDPKKPQRKRECYILKGDRNWQRTPQYISMLILLIRICLKYEVPYWINDAYALTGWWHEFIEKYNKANPYVSSENSDVSSFLANSYRQMLVMVAHDKEIFPHGIKEGYSPKGDNFHGTSGINALVTDSSFHPESAKKLRKYLTKEVV